MNGQNRAVVVGASISGLLTARALSETFDQVTLVDRDILPATPAVRRGAPQGRHAHLLLAAGCTAVEDLLPGFTQDAVRAGGLHVDLQEDLRWYCEGHRLCPAPSGLYGLAASRPLLEDVIRTRVAALPGVEIVAGCDAVGLASGGRGQQVAGVTILPRHDGAASSVLPADLVVDATGRSSRAPLWIAELGYHGPAEEQCGLGASFASRLYRREPGATGGRLGTAVVPWPDSPLGAILLAQEGGTFVLTTAGLGGAEPPADDAELVSLRRRLPGPDFTEVIRPSGRLTKTVRLRYPRSVRRRYDLLTRFPDGFLVTGDALCSLSPLYGQGMSVAAMEAVLLRRLLAHGPGQLAGRFFTAAAALLSMPWAMTCRTGQPREGQPCYSQDLGEYLSRFYAAAAGDPVLTGALLRVASLSEPPSALLTTENQNRVRGQGPEPRSGGAPGASGVTGVNRSPAGYVSGSNAADPAWGSAHPRRGSGGSSDDRSCRGGGQR